MKNTLNLKKMIKQINKEAKSEMRIMEVCGTHTQVIAKSGITSVLHPNIKLISGPGCPVCVTDESYIDEAIEILTYEDVIITTFGDLMKVKGFAENLLEQKAKGKDIRVVYSPLESIVLAEQNKDKKIIFLGIGFETTAPLIGILAKTIKEKEISNLFVLTDLKRMEPIIRLILSDSKNPPQGIICPGHVACITGSNSFEFITNDYNIPAVVCGFKAEDLVEGIYSLVKQINRKYPVEFSNLYKVCVKEEGNIVANKLLEEVFQIQNGYWRGIGLVGHSAMVLRNEYSDIDARKVFNLHRKNKEINNSCICKEILIGEKTPMECSLFKWTCTPENPIGPCMISSEGTCGIHYRYGGKQNG